MCSRECGSTKESFDSRERKHYVIFQGISPPSVGLGVTFERTDLLAPMQNTAHGRVGNLPSTPYNIQNLCFSRGKYFAATNMEAAVRRAPLISQAPCPYALTSEPRQLPNKPLVGLQILGRFWLEKLKRISILHRSPHAGNRRLAIY